MRGKTCCCTDAANGQSYGRTFQPAEQVWADHRGRAAHGSGVTQPEEGGVAQAMSVTS
jgi:hypothetical protein